MTFVGLTNYEKSSDGDREWFGRSAGWFIAVSIGWLILTVLVLIGSDLLTALFNQPKAVLSLGVITGAITAFIGKSRASPSHSEKAKGATAISLNAILAIAAVICGVLDHAGVSLAG
jgi:hypothetical protein